MNHQLATSNAASNSEDAMSQLKRVRVNGHELKQRLDELRAEFAIQEQSFAEVNSRCNQLLASIQEHNKVNPSDSSFLRGELDVGKWKECHDALTAEFINSSDVRKEIMQTREKLRFEIVKTGADLNRLPMSERNLMAQIARSPSVLSHK
jgi:predicted  nucleic acid-binding Zn-ribbon protein